MSAPILTLFEPPTSLDHPHVPAALEQLTLRNDDMARMRGSDEYALDIEQAIALWQHQEDEEVELWHCRVDGRLVSHGTLYLPRQAGSQLAQVHVRTAFEERGHGYGTLVGTHLLERARLQQRSIIDAWTEHAPLEGPQLRAETGFGEIPYDVAARLALRLGFRLEQAYRNSRVDTATAAARAAVLLPEALRHAEGYRFECWETPTASENADDLAWLRSRMSTDAPAGDAVIEEEIWDAERVHRQESSKIDSGLRTLIGVMRHEESGRLVALNELELDRARPTLTHQEYTLVLREHRGHRLGMVVKCLTLQEWLRRVPETERIETYNAEENRPMLDINEALGFRAIQYSGVWQRRLED